MCTPTHFKSLSLICEELENSETKKKVALQRSYHSVSWLVSWSDNSRRSQPGSLPPPLMSASQHFLLPLMRGWQDHSAFRFVEAVVKRFLNTPPILSVMKPLSDTQLQTSSTSKTSHYSVSPSEPVSAQCSHLQQLHAT